MSDPSSPSLAFPTPLPSTGQWSGLNLLLTRARLGDLQTAVANGDAPTTQACNDAINAAESYKNQQPNPIVGVLQVPSFYGSPQDSVIQQQIVAQIRTDAWAAHGLAWGYAFTGRADYVATAKAILFAWVNNLTQPVDGPGDPGLAGIEDLLLGEEGGDTALVMHYTFPHFLYAYDILNGFGQFSADEQAQFTKWLAPFINYRLSEERFVNNHQNWQVLFMGAAAHVTADQNLFNMAVGYYRDGMHHQQIAADGSMWRELARGAKAATYTLMALEAMVQFVAIANNHGVTDLRDVVADARDSEDAFLLDEVTHLKHSGVASAGGTLLDAFNSLQQFLTDPAAWTARFQNVIGSPTANGPVSPSDWGWIFEVGNAWFPTQSFGSFLQDAPYGLLPARAYTLSYATLLFRPLPS